MPIQNFPRTSHGRGAAGSSGSTIACAVAGAAALGLLCAVSAQVSIACAVAAASAAGVQASVTSGNTVAASVATATAAGLSASVASDDFAARSANAFLATMLDNATQINAWKVPDSTADHISLDTALKPVPTRAGSLKHAVLNSDGTASGQTTIPFGISLGEGATFWYSFKRRAPATHCFQP